MSGKKSLVIISASIALLILFVYHFSTPRSNMHLARVVGDNTELPLPPRDSIPKMPDTLQQFKKQ